METLITILLMTALLILITAYSYIKWRLLFYIGNTILMPDGRHWTNKNLALPFLGWANPEAPKDYGRYYNFRHVKIINFILKIFATGYHVPTDKEWTAMIDACGENAGIKLMSKKGWNYKAKGNDEYGFNAVPGGWISGNGSFIGLYNHAKYWSSSLHGSIYAWARRIPYCYTYVGYDSTNRSHRLSIRLIKNK